MGNIIAIVFALFVTIPIVTWVFLYFLFAFILKNKKRAFQISTDLSTFFAMIAVYLLIYQIWQISVFWLIIILILLCGMIFTTIYWKLGKDIEIRKMIRGIWRLNFLLFMSAYLLLFIYGMISGLINT